MAEAERHLRVVDMASGQVVEDAFAADLCPECRRKDDLIEDLARQLEDAELDLRKKRAGLRLLNAQLTEKLEGHARRPEVERIHAKWQRLCRHPKSPLDNARALAITHILDAEVDGEKAFSERDAYLAIIGAAYDAFVDEKGKRHDSIGLIFRNAEKFEDFANRGHRVLRARPDLAMEAEPPADPQGALPV